MKVDEQTLKTLMAAVFQVAPDTIDETSSIDTIPTWDSLRHINLIVALEDEFGLRVQEEDVPDLTSYAIIRLTLQDAPDR